MDKLVVHPSNTWTDEQKNGCMDEQQNGWHKKQMDGQYWFRFWSCFHKWQLPDVNFNTKFDEIMTLFQHVIVLTLPHTATLPHPDYYGEWGNEDLLLTSGCVLQNYFKDYFQFILSCYCFAPILHAHALGVQIIKGGGIRDRIDKTIFALKFILTSSDIDGAGGAGDRVRTCRSRSRGHKVSTGN